MINRNNYEEYFLLLADNELSAEEAVAVKQFAAQHPDLGEELNILLSCRLEDVSIPAFPKEKLLRPTLWNIENLEPLQTQMLLLLDGELPLTQKQQLEKQIASNAAVQSEWESLQQAKLVEEAIAHPNKDSLRHIDSKVRPVLWMRWAAAAAVVAGLGWMFWLHQAPELAAPSITVASNKMLTQKPNATIPVDTPLPPVKAEELPIKAEQTAAIPATTHNVAPRHTDDVAPDESNLYLAISNQTATTPTAQNKSAEPEPLTARLSNASISLDINDASPEPVVQVAHLSKKAVILPVFPTSQKTELFTGSKTDLLGETDDYVTVGAAHINKQKMRGLLRNVTRTVARSFTKSKMEPDVYATR